MNSSLSLTTVIHDEIFKVQSIEQVNVQIDIRILRQKIGDRKTEYSIGHRFVFAKYGISPQKIMILIAIF